MEIPLRDLTEPDELLTRAQVAALLSVAPSTVTRWADEGKLTYIRTLGGHRRYQKREIATIMSLANSELDAKAGTLKEESMQELEVETPKFYGDHQTAAIHQALFQLPGVQQVWASPATHSVKVSFEPAQVSAETILSRLAKAGYPVRNGHVDQADHGKDPSWAKLNLRMTQTHGSGA